MICENNTIESFVIGALIMSVVFAVISGIYLKYYKNRKAK